MKGIFQGKLDLGQTGDGLLDGLAVGSEGPTRRTSTWALAASAIHVRRPSPIDHADVQACSGLPLDAG